MSERALCIGGPRDGQWICLPEGSRYVECAARLSDFCFPVEDTSLPVAELSVTIHRYRRERLSGKDDDGKAQFAPVFIYERMSTAAAMRALLENYRPR